jgi:hypothetical protein
MRTYEGFVGESPDGLARIYLADDPRRYVDVPLTAIVHALATDLELVHNVTLADDADVVPGQLDEEGFRALFTAEQRPQAYSSFYHTTKFWNCKYSISVC